MQNKRIYFWAVLSLVLFFVSKAIFAAASEDGLCEHHPEHTAECGYVEAVTPCSYSCTICTQNSNPIVMTNSDSIELQNSLNYAGEMLLNSDSDRLQNSIKWAGEVEVGGCTIDQTLVVDKAVTLDLVGGTLRMTGQGSVIKVTSTGTLTLVDSVGGGMITGGNAEDGGGIYVDKGKVIMKGGKICQNNASKHGGGVYLTNGGKFELQGGEISNNTANWSGAGVYAYGVYSEFIMTGGSISGNNGTLTKGGGMYLDTSSKLKMSGGQISGNQASTGGGVYMSNGTLEMSGNAQISGNTASSQGGGVYIPGNSRFSMNGGEISGNSAKEIGGGLYINLNTNSKKVSVTNGKIKDNTCGSFGGGIYIFVGCVAMSGEVIIYDNNKVSGNNRTPDNFYAEGLANKCVFTGDLTGNSKIGYKTTQFYLPTSGKPVQISTTESGTKYYETAVKYFVSDMGYNIRANDVGYLQLERVHTHNWSSEWSKDESHHWHECTALGCSVADAKEKKEYGNHSYTQRVVSESYLASPATCTQKATYYMSCECGMKGNEIFEGELDATNHTGIKEWTTKCESVT